MINHPEINHIHLPESAVDDCFSCTIHEFNQRRLLDMRANSVNVRPRPLAEWLASGSKRHLLKHGENNCRD